MNILKGCGRDLMIGAVLLPLAMLAVEETASAAPSIPNLPKYVRGYDPAKIAPGSIGDVPAGEWGASVNGLQAALRSPDSVKMNAVSTIYVVVRNVSQKTIRVSFGDQLEWLRIQRANTPLIYSKNDGGRPTYVSWELLPGHQVNIPSGKVQFLAKDDVGLKTAFRAIKPGLHRFTASVEAPATQVKYLPSGQRIEIRAAPGDWVGRLKPPPRLLQVLAQKAPFAVQPPVMLKKIIDVEPTFASPPFSRTHNAWTDFDAVRQHGIPLGEGVIFHLSTDHQQQWLSENGRYTKTVYWGPFSIDRLSELRLFEPIRSVCLASARKSSGYDLFVRSAILMRSSKQMASLGLDLLMYCKSLNKFTGNERFIRNLRDQRVELLEMGLQEKYAKAEARLSRDEPPLPAAERFQEIGKLPLRVKIAPSSWGPENAGLRAAAICPEVVSQGDTAAVRIFIRNVSQRDIHLTVSENPGFDYATAMDDQGEKITTSRAFAQTMAFGSNFAPPINPGQATQYPPTATLKYLRLQPGATWELKTKTALRLTIPGKTAKPVAPDLSHKNQRPAVTTIIAKPGKALVTWRLHTANGAAYTPDLKQQIWPANGGWTGLLTTAPCQVQLKE